MGTMCFVIPRRMGVFLVALVYLLTASLGLIYVWFQLIRHTVHNRHVPNCQLGECSSQVYDLFTCPHTAGLSMNVQMVLTVAGGFVFGTLALRGLHDDNADDLVAFSRFQYLSLTAGLCCLAVDLVFVDLCDKAPALWLTGLALLQPEKFAVLHRMGYEPSATAVEDIGLAMGVDVVRFGVTAYVVVLLAFLFVAYHAGELARLCAYGPAGLGPLYGVEIDQETTREFQHAVHALMENAKGFARGENTESVPFAQLKPSWLEAGDGLDAGRYGKFLPLAETPNDVFDYASVHGARAGTERVPLVYHDRSYGATSETFVEPNALQRRDSFVEPNALEPHRV